MNLACARVLDYLKKHKRGISFHNFPIGFRLGARVFELRKMGHDIVTTKVPMADGAYYARYVLWNEKK